MSDEQRTMTPTAKRRQLARAEGRVAVSDQVSAAAVVFVAGVAWYLAGGRAFEAMQAVMAHAWRARLHGANASVVLPQLLHECATLAGRFVLPLVGFVWCAAILSRFAQVGPVWAPRRVAPRMQRLHAAPRVSTWFSFDTLLELLSGLALIVSVLALAGAGLWLQRHDLRRLGAEATSTLPDAAISLCSLWGMRLAGCLAVFAALDYGRQRLRHEASLRMTPEELRNEVQQVRGNPQVSAARRGRREELRHGNG